MPWCSSALSEFRTSLSKVLTLWHCVKVKQRYHNIFFVFFGGYFYRTVQGLIVLVRLYGILCGVMSLGGI